MARALPRPSSPAPRARSPLKEKLAEHTHTLLLEAAMRLVVATSFDDVTMRALAEEAEISERTVFRYFPSREALADAVADGIVATLALPSLPGEVAALPSYAARLFRAFEGQSALTRAALHPELFARISSGPARRRWEQIAALLDREAPTASAEERLLVGANVRLVLSATCWNYYRRVLGFDAALAERAASRLVEDALRGLTGD